jgi:hypothetical protein
MARVRLLQRRFAVRVPVERAWAHLARVEEWPRWARHIRRIELTPAGPLTARSEGLIRLSSGVRSRFRVVELEPGVSWRWVGPFLWLSVDCDHRFHFHPVDAQSSEIEFVVEAEGWGVGVLGRVFAAIYALSLDRAIPRLIAELERPQR